MVDGNLLHFWSVLSSGSISNSIDLKPATRSIKLAFCSKIPQELAQDRTGYDQGTVSARHGLRSIVLHKAQTCGNKAVFCEQPSG